MSFLDKSASRSRGTFMMRKCEGCCRLSHFCGTWTSLVFGQKVISPFSSDSRFFRSFLQNNARPSISHNKTINLLGFDTLVRKLSSLKTQVKVCVWYLPYDSYIHLRRNFWKRSQVKNRLTRLKYNRGTYLAPLSPTDRPIDRSIATRTIDHIDLDASLRESVSSHLNIVAMY